MRNALIKLVEGKHVQICCHWDVDGVCSGAMLYHILKPYASKITTSTKGKPFLITTEDVDKDAAIIICTDISPSVELLSLTSRHIVYIDHHPNKNAKRFHFSIHRPETKSTTLLIYDTMLKGTKDPYMLFLTLLGYFGDGGDRNKIPKDLFLAAMESIPEMMQKCESQFGEGFFFEIERYVSVLNAGKRMHWSGDVPLELLKSIDNYEPLVNNIHPLAVQLQQYKLSLKDAYQQDVKIETINGIDLCIISDPRNIQGVLAARHITKERPIIVMNILNDIVIGSVRVHEELDFNAGEFVEQFNDRIKSFLGKRRPRIFS